MTRYTRKRTREAFRNFLHTILWRRPFSVSLTPRLVCFVDGRLCHLSEEYLKQNVRHFFNRLKRRLYGNRRNAQLNRLACVEHRKTMHVHCVIDVPDNISASDFDKIVKEEWRRTIWGNNNCKTQPEMNNGWIDYMLKSRSKDREASECFDFENSAFDFVVTKASDVRADH